MKKLTRWIKEVAEIANPDIFIGVMGSKEEYDHMMEKLFKSGSAIPL